MIIIISFTYSNDYKCNPTPGHVERKQLCKMGFICTTRSLGIYMNEESELLIYIVKTISKLIVQMTMYMRFKRHKYTREWNLYRMHWEFKQRSSVISVAKRSKDGAGVKKRIRIICLFRLFNAHFPLPQSLVYSFKAPNSFAGYTQWDLLDDQVVVPSFIEPLSDIN